MCQEEIPINSKMNHSKLIIFVLLSFVIGCVTSGSIFFCRSKKRTKNFTEEIEIEKLLISEKANFVRSLSEKNDKYFDEGTRNRLLDMFIPWKFIKVGDTVLGEGQFGPGCNYFRI